MKKIRLAAIMGNKETGKSTLFAHSERKRRGWSRFFICCPPKEAVGKGEKEPLNPDGKRAYDSDSNSDLPQGI